MWLSSRRGFALTAGALWLLLSPLPSCDSGSSTGGQAPGMPRLGPADRPSQDELISDFEGEGLSFEMTAGWGRWLGTGADEADGLELRTGGAAGSERALQVSGPDAVATALFAERDGAALQLDVQTCSGLRFWTRGQATGSLSVRLHSAQGSVEAVVETGAEWAEVTLDWDDFERTDADPGSADLGSGLGGASAGGAPGEAGGAGGAGPGVFRRRALTAIDFAFDAGEGWLDEVAFTSCQLPRLNPPLPAPPELGSMAPAGSPVARHGQLRVAGKTLVDQKGEPVQLKGVSSMWLNWDSMGLASNKQALTFMRDEWDLSVFRVALGVEPDNAYLTNPNSERRKLERAIANALELGVYVIVDWHAHEAESDPDAARGLFDELAAAYGQYPNVIWETFNEPLRVDWRRDLKPYHTSLIETIRKHDPDNLILLGTPQWSQLVDEAAADPIGARNTMYVLHFYSCTHTDWLRDAANRALAAGVGLFVTEFGGTHADGGRDGIVCEAETRAWFDWMDTNGVSGVAWKLDKCSQDSSCLLSPSAPSAGPWRDEHLNGHAPLVVEWMRH